MKMNSNLEFCRTIVVKMEGDWTIFTGSILEENHNPFPNWNQDFYHKFLNILVIRVRPNKNRIGNRTKNGISKKCILLF